MTVAFLDTNALLKQYLSEKGAVWLTNFVRDKQIVISELALFESSVVLRRRYTEANLTRVQAVDLLDRVKRDSLNYQIVPLGGDLQLAELQKLIFKLSNSLVIRTLDSLHLTAAQLAFNAATKFNPPEPFVFVSSDRQLLRVAQATGFPVENPEDYP